ncbi:MAG: hypothetical protein QXW71_01185 [Thermoplasmata archaeon]
MTFFVKFFTISMIERQGGRGEGGRLRGIEGEERRERGRGSALL